MKLKNFGFGRVKAESGGEPSVSESAAQKGALCAVRRAAPLPPHLCLLPPPCEKSAEAARKKSAHGRFF